MGWGSCNELLAWEASFFHLLFQNVFIYVASTDVCFAITKGIVIYKSLTLVTYHNTQTWHFWYLQTEAGLIACITPLHQSNCHPLVQLSQCFDFLPFANLWTAPCSPPHHNVWTAPCSPPHHNLWTAPCSPPHHNSQQTPCLFVRLSFTHQRNSRSFCIYSTLHDVSALKC